ncbi:MAG: TlpA disulfide reductase family protein [Corynebacterium sp.]|uniref:TlpA family protein disulfide reductase n=1 Tax=Corynebacterium sp. TaxID=1720 RepID=UPI0026DD32CF|nr:TlpA disulfide reductase family protein [Corynebacterium sp.]MDO5030803.1 TlpA disulfide reductase family protein [Corynebacterium sp.]
MTEQDKQSLSGDQNEGQPRDVNRSASLITLLIAGISVVGLVIFAIVNTTGGGSEADSAADPASETAASGSASAQPSEPAMSKDEIAAVAGSNSLAGVRLPALVGDDAATSQLVDMGELVEGKPTIVNVWAWNCAPCRKELPLIEQWAKDNPDVQVLTVHAAREAKNGRAFLQEVGVNLPAYSDTVDVVGPALNLPRVVPLTVIFKADGTVAKVHPGEFTSAQQITEAVRGALGGES